MLLEKDCVCDRVVDSWVFQWYHSRLRVSTFDDVHKMIGSPNCFLSSQPYC